MSPFCGFHVLLFLLFPFRVCSSSLSPALSIALLPGNSLENFAVRANGQILATSSGPSPNLWQIDPLRIRSPTLVATFPGTSGTFGITEVQPDVFYVATGNITFNGISVSSPAAYSVWRVDMASFQVPFNNTIVSPAKISKVIDMPPHACINGMTSILNSSARGPSFLLAADSVNGLVWSISLPVDSVSEVFVGIKDTTMLPPPPSQSLGINGIKYFNSSIYYTNSTAFTLYAYAIDQSTGRAPSFSSAVLIANLTLPDDLILDTFNPSVAFVCYQGLGAALRVDLVSGETVSVASNFSGPSAVAWGRDVSDGSSLYLTINGGIKGDVAAQAMNRIDLGNMVL
ncbi:hypothetical protein N431DRAFT_511362 [Stipitochalara longipes BDJ]|nr:hypothetical protein N431DRAFT_511362 [Stipitochalara longipes BDJ]